MSKPEITTGDDAVLMHELTKYDKDLKQQVTFNIPDTATVKTRIIAADHSEAYSESVVQSDLTAGADWPNSLVAVVLDSTITSEILSKSVLWKNGRVNAKIETQVDDGGKTTWFASVVMIKGLVE